MKRLVNVLAIVVVVLSLTISLSPALNSKLISRENEATSPSASVESSKGNIAGSMAQTSDRASDVADAQLRTGENGVSETAYLMGEYPFRSESPCSEPTGPFGVTPPDGAIFYGGDPPYAYIPTYDPKEKGLPIIPLEPDT